MGQPKLSNASTQQLLAVGPLNGLDASTDAFFLDGQYVRDMLNFVPNHGYLGLTQIRGRVGGRYYLPSPPTSLAIFYSKTEDPRLVTVTQEADFAWQDIPNPAQWARINIPFWNSIGPTGMPGSFIRYKAWLFFTNEDPNALCYKFDTELKATFWGIAPPPGHPMETTTSPPNGMIYGDNIYYRYTYSADNATDPGLSQESSPSPAAGPFKIGTPLGPPSSSGATIAQTPAPTLAQSTAGGTIPPGTYFIGTTWVTAAGEEGISVTASTTVTGAPPNEILVTPSSPPSGATGYNIYAGTSSDALTQQGGTRSGTSGQFLFNYATTGAAAPPYTGFLDSAAYADRTSDFWWQLAAAHGVLRADLRQQQRRDCCVTRDLHRPQCKCSCGRDVAAGQRQCDGLQRLCFECVGAGGLAERFTDCHRNELDGANHRSDPWTVGEFGRAKLGRSAGHAHQLLSHRRSEPGELVLRR